MASISWVFLLFLPQIHTLLATSNGHQAGDSNLTQLSVPFLCHPGQAKVLLQLKESFSFRSSTTRLSSWRNGTDCCFWEGVGCDDSSGNVTVLDLNNRGLSSSRGLDPAVFSLTSLRYLDLSMNDFSTIKDKFVLPDKSVLPDSIPATGFEMLALLTHLNLSNLGLQGKIPIGISKLVNLRSLDLSSTSFDCASSDPLSCFYSSDTYNILSDTYNILSDTYNILWEPNFGTLVANLSNLRQLYLDGVDLSRGGEEWCESLAISVPHLKVLSLAHCDLRDPIRKSLLRLHSLTVINLQGNYDISAGPFPKFFMDFPNLTVLQLSGTNLEGWFPPRPFQSRNLRVLDLSANQNLTGHLPKLSNASSLETLRLVATNFLYDKPTSFSGSKSLKELSLDGSSGHVDFLSSFGRLGSLSQLDLVLNSISELESIFSWIGKQKNLKSLALTGCDFGITASSLVGNFKTLRSLTMIECNVPSSILSAIGNLMGLQTLEMYTCKTYGPIPSSIGNLTNLRHLSIASCSFSGPMLPVIVNLTNLETLVIHNQVDQFLGTVPSSIGQLNKLAGLSLAVCSFSGRIPNSIANLTRLTKLELSDNDFSGEIPSSIFSLPALRELDLSRNLLSGPIQKFDKAPSSLLESVDLSNNNFSGHIPKAFFQLTSLKHLDVSSNNFVGLVDLTMFWRLSKLTSLHLSNNKLHVVDVEGHNPLPTDFYGPNVLGLASCNITQFPRTLRRINYMSHLDLSHNKISGDVPNWVWETWSGSLTYLDISHNMLTSLQLTSNVLPFTSTLQTIDLSFNRFCGWVPMPNSSAHVLDYSNNNFSSVFPNFTLYLSYTSYLSMSKNFISGHIPISVCNSILSVLDLSYNYFSGPIPSCLIERTPLLVLNLRNNHFEGMFPCDITTGCALQTIDLHGNKIEGQLPRGLSNCSDLEVLDFGGNRITDTFPYWLRRLRHLSVIVLRSNQFYGSISDMVLYNKSDECFSSLQIIDLSSNNFSGNLTSQWFENLESMMTGSRSTGEIISAVGLITHRRFYQDYVEIMYKGSVVSFERILTTLTAIDFSNNRLEGVIPKSIGRLVSLRVLNMSHNAFTGKIPAQLGGITDLESLDLSCNKIAGEIPQELTELTFLDVLNLSNNHLVGKIPQSRQFYTFDSSSFEGNAGLCGPPLTKLPCGTSPYTPSAEHVGNSNHVDVVLFLFVGLGFGVGFAAAIVVKWNRVGRWFIATARASRTAKFLYFSSFHILNLIPFSPLISGFNLLNILMKY